MPTLPVADPETPIEVAPLLGVAGPGHRGGFDLEESRPVQPLLLTGDDRLDLFLGTLPPRSSSD